ncbi:MAG: hypothetical protein EPO68_03350 [Planctomycetota bacterium]|nr:MAG: hypothetical protein EPO68_03350 [Planctomycetota bacterium]
MRAALTSRLAAVFGSAALFLLLCGGSCQVATSWCSDAHCTDGCGCDGGTCCTAGTCCDTVSADAPAPIDAVIVTTSALGEERAWLDAHGRVVRLDAIRYAPQR